MDDRTLSCSDCGEDFVFTTQEQEFFRSHNLLNDPKRCPPCRKKRKAMRRGGRPADRGPKAVSVRRVRTPRPPDRPEAAATKGPRELHTATCSACGNETQVPFVPDGVRPVYCLPCLKQQTR